MREVEKFIEVISPKVPMVYRSIATTWIAKTITKEEALSNKDDNIYFLWGLSEWASRMTDSDIEEIHYIRLDIDIKKWVKEFLWADIDGWDILAYIDEIKETLDDSDFLNDWSYIVFSWWGCHIYYSNTEWVKIDNTITPKVWQLAMKRIYSRYDLEIDDQSIWADKAVCNTARIMRLPDTINQKHWEECKIIYSEPDRQSKMLSYVKPLGLDELKKKEELTKQRAKEIDLMRQKLVAEWWQDTDLKYEIINRLPAYLIAQMLLPQFSFDGKKNFTKEGKLKWYYYVEETNSICNWWSEEFAWGSTESCWNNYSLVEKQLWLSKADTFKFFEEKFTL